jgi:hypothetical protein
VDVSAVAIRRLINAGLHPIIIFLHAESITTVRKQNPTLDEATCTQVYDLSTRVCVVEIFWFSLIFVKVEQEYSPLFTAVINNVKLDETFSQVYVYVCLCACVCVCVCV